MIEVINAEEVGFNNHEIKNYLDKMDSKGSFIVDQLVYYPYFFFEYTLERKSFPRPTGAMVGCTVDGINGIGSLIDGSPKFKKKQIDPQNIIQKKLGSFEVSEISKDFLYDSISYKLKVLSMPKLTLTKKEVFYRPYWIAEGRKHSSDRFLLTVDAVTGKYHPL
ncbi:hypothetical protein [Virgibacillus siamensis]|uniref:hypothetical protein n=1 Tax=Virgibacillus siamensis TaxID=480071 RepID=UPI000984F67F|nr:hypothetical protein [Virgibacillus siamensis]